MAAEQVRVQVPSRGKRLLLTQRMASHANTALGMPQEKAVLVIQKAPSPRQSLEVIISASRLDEDS